MPSLLPLLLPFIPGSGGSSTPTPDDPTGTVSFAVEVAWNDTPRTASPTYYDVTTLTRASAGLSFQRGRSNEQDAQAQPGRAGFELFNDAGSLTIGDASWTYDPIRLRRPCRVRAAISSPDSSSVLDDYDSDFEGGGLGGWVNVTNSVLTNSATAAHGGTRALRLASIAAGNMSAWTSTTYPVTAGDGWTAVAWVLSIASARTCRIDLFWYDSGGTVITSTQGTAATSSTSAWTELTATGEAPVAAASVKPLLFVSSTGGASELHLFDDVTLSRTTARYPLWQGFVDSWENGTDNTLGTVRVSASDRLARAARVKLPGYVEGEILADSPSAYFPLGDSAESTTAGDLSTRGVPPLTVTQNGTGGVAELGVGVSPGPDGGTVAAFTPVTTGDFQNLVTTDVGQFGYDATGGYTLSCFVKTTVVEADTNIVKWLVSLVAADGLGGTYLYLGGDKLAGYGASLSDGEWHHVAYVSDYDAYTGTFYVDGAVVHTNSPGYGPRDTLYVGGTNGGAFEGQLAHVAVFPQPLSGTRIAAHAAAGLTSDVGELTSGRFERLCLHGGLPSTHYASSAGLSTMAAQPTRGVALLDALKACAEAENGYVSVDSAGVLRFSPRTDRYAASSALTLNAQLGGHVGDDFTYITDDSLIVNDVTVTRPGGPTQRAVDVDSVTAYDTQDESLTLYLDTDAEAQAAAQWRVFSYSEPLARASNLTIDLTGFAANAGDVPALLSLELGSVVTVTNLPDDVSVESSVDLVVEGISWRVSTSGAQVSLTTSPLGSSGVAFIFDDATHGTFDGPGRFAY